MITFEAIDKFDNLADILGELHAQMEKNHQGTWICCAYALFGSHIIRYNSGTFINFKLDVLDLSLFQP